MKYIYIPDIKLKKAVNEELVKLLGKREMLQDITDDEILNISIIYYLYYNNYKQNKIIK